MKRTYKPSLLKMKRKHGFRQRKRTKILLRRKLKQRYYLSH